MLRKSLLLSLLLPSLLLGAETKPRRTAFLQSLVVPGWGQYSLGRKNSALAFFGTELLLIGGMYTFRAYGTSAREDYKAMAARYAGVMGDHDHDYYVDVGNWMSIHEYNERRLQERNFDELYVSEADFWQWDSDRHRAEMRLRRVKSDRALNSVTYLIGGVVLNHIASAIHAGRTSARQDVSASGTSLDAPWSVAVQPASGSSGLRLMFTRNF